MDKKILLGLTVASVVTLLSGMALAAPIRANENNKYSPLVQGLVDKFGLNKNEVDTVITTVRGQQMQKRQAEIDTKLSQAVNDKKLTQAQKDELVKLQTEWRDTRPDNWASMSNEERKTYMDTHQDAMHAWATKNNVDIESILGFGGRGGFDRGNGEGRGMMRD